MPQVSTDSSAAAGTLTALVIEDETTIAEFLRIGLSYEGWDVTVAVDGAAGVRLALREPFDLLILDLMFPDLDGITVCQRLRAAGHDVPIIMLTAKGETADRVAGLDHGADDYLTKPFSFEELLARIRAVRRRLGRAEEPVIFQAAGLALDPETHEARRGDELLDLTPTEFALLEFFLRHPRRAFSRETLFNRVWGFDHVGDTNVVDVHISNLRDKIGDGSKRLIRTIYGVGYNFRPDDDVPPS